MVEARTRGTEGTGLYIDAMFQLDSWLFGRVFPAQKSLDIDPGFKIDGENRVTSRFWAKCQLGLAGPCSVRVHPHMNAMMTCQRSGMPEVSYPV